MTQITFDPSNFLEIYQSFSLFYGHYLIEQIVNTPSVYLYFYALDCLCVNLCQIVCRSFCCCFFCYNCSSKFQEMAIGFSVLFLLLTFFTCFCKQVPTGMQFEYLKYSKYSNSRPFDGQFRNILNFKKKKINFNKLIIIFNFHHPIDSQCYIVLCMQQQKL